MNGDKVSVSASHELVEMLVDPAVNMMTTGPDPKTVYADEAVPKFQILAGGYQIIWKHGKWSEIFGSGAKKKRFRRADRRGHRSEQRGKRPLKRSA